MSTIKDLKKYLVIQDGNTFGIWPKNRYNNYIRKTLDFGACPAVKVIAQFNGDEDGLAASESPSKGMKWVKASERLPERNKQLNGRYTGKYKVSPGVVWDSNLIKGYITFNGNLEKVEDVEWLDESTESDPSNPVSIDFLPVLKENLEAMKCAKEMGWKDVHSSQDPFDCVIETYEDMIEIYKSRKHTAGDWTKCRCDNQFHWCFVHSKWGRANENVHPSNPVVESVPIWYKKQDVIEWLIHNNYSKKIAEELSEHWARDLQGAFKKGWEKATNDNRTEGKDYKYYNPVVDEQAKRLAEALLFVNKLLVRFDAEGRWNDCSDCERLIQLLTRPNT